MKYLIGLLCFFSVAQAQFAPTSAKTKFVNGIGIGSKDTSQFTAADTIALTIARDSVMYYRYRGFWRPIATGGNLSAYKLISDTLFANGYTTRARLKQGLDSLAATKGTVNSVGLTMPVAFNVANSPITSSGTIAVTAAGNATQYIRGDGALATLPTSGSGGGASVSYYLNGSVNQGTIGGVTYYEMNKTPIIGAGTNFSITADGYIASFLTDANDPALLKIPAGNWNFETYFSASSGGGTPTFYLELYKYNGTTFTLIASNSGSPKLISDGTNIEAYFSTLAVPETVLTLTDRLAVRIYVSHSGRTITLHTENGHLCQVITTFTTGLTALNGLTEQVQYFSTGTSGTDFNIASSVATHTFNLPTASATNRGALSSANWTTFNNKIGAGDTAAMLAPYYRTATATAALATKLNISDTAAMLSPYARTANLPSLAPYKLISDTLFTNGYTTRGTTKKVIDSLAALELNISDTAAMLLGYTRVQRFTDSLTNVQSRIQTKQNILTLTTTGSSGAATLTGATLNIPQYAAASGSTAYIQNGTSQQASSNFNISGLGRASSFQIGTFGNIDTSGANFRFNYYDGFAWVNFLSVNNTTGLVSTPQNVTLTGSASLTTSNIIGANIGIGKNYMSSFNDASIDMSRNGLTNSNILSFTTVSNSDSWQMGVIASAGSTREFSIRSGTSGKVFAIDYLTGAATFSGSISASNGTLIGGTGTTNYLPKFTGSTTVGNSVIQESSSLIGINVTPTRVLHLSSSGANAAIRLDNTVSGRPFLLTYDDSQNLTFINSSDIGYIAFNSGTGTSTTKMLLTNSGNLGLGVTPSAWSGRPAIQIADDAYIVSNNGNIFFGTNTYFNGSARTYISTGAAAMYRQVSGQHRWETAASGTANTSISFTQAMTLGANGNLLVGTTTDNGNRLQVSGAATFSGNVGIGQTASASFGLAVSSGLPSIFTATSAANSATYGGSIFYRGINTIGNGNGLTFNMNNSSSNSAEYVYIGGIIETNTAGAENGAFIIAPSASGTRTERFRIASSGAATFSSSVTATQFITGGTPSNTAGFTNSFYAESNVPSLTLSNTGTNTGKFTLGVTNGNFGIWNNATSNYPLFINSSNAITLNSLGTGTVYSNAGLLTNTNPSDSALKNTIKDYTYGLNEILQLKPKTYYYNTDSSKSMLKYGFVAQEVQSIMPDAVRKLEPNKSDSKLGLETDAIYVALINAIKTLEARIKVLESKQ